MSVHRFTDTRRISKHVRTDATTTEGKYGHSTSYKQIYDPVIADLELLIDVDGLMRMMGNRAVNSKGRKAMLQSGLIKVRVLKERPE